MNRNVQYRVVWPPFTKSVIALSATFFLLWIIPVLVAPVGAFVSDHLILSAPNILGDYEVWSLFTYGLFHTEFFGAFFSGLALWLFGAELQSRWSTRRWWGVQAAAVLLGGVVSFLALWLFDSATGVRGYQAGIMALVTAYCWLWWRRPLNFFFVEMTGRTMLLVFLGFSILMSAFSGYWPMIALDLCGVAVGFLASSRSLSLRDLRVRLRNWRLRRKLSVVPKSPEATSGGKTKRKTADGTYIN